ncbi:MAG: hypothetical protein C0445_05735 [Polaromonas sp.]|nr:hypothetical protein [Polaromonas sp.]
MNDARLIDAAAAELDKAFFLLDLLAPESGTYRACIGTAMEAIRKADTLLAQVTLAKQAPHGET